jgi:hypothetical protein
MRVAGSARSDVSVPLSHSGFLLGKQRVLGDLVYGDAGRCLAAITFRD